MLVLISDLRGCSSESTIASGLKPMLTKEDEGREERDGLWASLSGSEDACSMVKTPWQWAACCGGANARNRAVVRGAAAVSTEQAAGCCRLSVACCRYDDHNSDASIYVASIDLGQRIHDLSSVSEPRACTGYVPGIQTRHKRSVCELWLDKMESPACEFIWSCFVIKLLVFGPLSPRREISCTFQPAQ